MARIRKRGGRAAGAHHPRMPQPFIDPLPIQATFFSRSNPTAVTRSWSCEASKGDGARAPAPE
jgi:hypothetical protein